MVILVMFAVVSAGGVAASVLTTRGAQDSAAVVQVAGRQRTLAERYVDEVLLRRGGRAADPGLTGRLLEASGQVLLSGGTAPAVNGDDDQSSVSAASDPVERAQLREELRLVTDLIGTGNAILAGRPVGAVPLSGGETTVSADPPTRLRVLAALTSNVAQNASRTVVADADRRVGTVVALEVVFGAAALVASLILGGLLIAATRRQTAHFRTLIRSSSDLMVIFAETGACRYVSPSVTRMVGARESTLLGTGFADVVDEADRVALQTPVAMVRPDGKPMRFRIRAAGRSWREIEATVTDLSADRDVWGVVVNGRDITDRVALEEQLTHQAFHDPLTGLANRSLFADRLDHALQLRPTTDRGIAVLLADLDGFKGVNDTLGHGVGDQLLIEVARRLVAATRPGDTVARLGGDEFAVILEDVDEPGARATAERIVSQAAAAVHIAGRDVFVGASVGVTVVAQSGTGREDLIRQADVAMYAAKHSGRGRYQVFHSDLARRTGDLLGLEHEIRDGLTRGEFRLYYQPEVDLASGRINGVEALMRWQSPTRGLTGPAAFIPAAESTSAILALGEFAVREACAQTRRWEASGVLSEDFTTWVNVSARQLTAGGIQHVFSAALTDAGINPARLGLELTETALVADEASFDNACTQLEQLHSAGVKIAIDDFGTGYSSLSHLRRFPVDILKVDQSFIAGVDSPGKDAAITANTISLAHALGLTAVAEGIETDQQLQELRRLGCDTGQGYLFAQPVPPDEVTVLLRSQPNTTTDQSLKDLTTRTPLHRTGPLTSRGSTAAPASPPARDRQRSQQDLSSGTGRP